MDIEIKGATITKRDDMLCENCGIREGCFKIPFTNLEVCMECKEIIYKESGDPEKIVDSFLKIAPDIKKMNLNPTIFKMTYTKEDKD